MTKSRAVNELLFAGALWGFGFVAARWALESYSAIETTFYRFLIAFTIGETLRFFIHVQKQNKSTNFFPTPQNFWLGLGGGLLLGLMLLLQTIGLKTTTASKSGFITTLYVILVPLIQHSIFKVHTPKKLYAYVALALWGTWLLVGGKMDSIQKGDIWTLGCSLVAALHIIYLGHASKNVTDSFQFNNLQSLACIILLAPLYIQEGKFTIQGSDLALAGLLFLGIGSSIIAFMIQIRTQRVLSATTASMLFLLESPFAMLFGILILGEKLTSTSILGAGLIIMAAILTILLEQTSQTK